MVAGPPCSGKSTLARTLSQLLNAPHLEMDAFRQRLLPHSDQRVEHRDLAYRAMHYAAELLAPWCPTLILDATYTAAACRAELVQVVDRVGGQLFVIERGIDAVSAQQRFAMRHLHAAVDLTAERVVQLVEGYPYSDAAFAVADDSRVTLVDSQGRLVIPALSAAAGAEWCRRGQPRES